MQVVVWGAPHLTEALIRAGLTLAEQHAARAALVHLACARDLEALRRIGEVLPVVAMVDDASLALRAVELGALGVLAGDATATEIAAALEAVAGGRAAIAASAAQLLVEALRKRAATKAQFALTGRERDVLGELIAGHTTHTIASRLGIGFSTVQTHLKSIYRKLDVGSKAAATAMALRHQLV